MRHVPRVRPAAEVRPPQRHGGVRPRRADGLRAPRRLPTARPGAPAQGHRRRRVGPAAAQGEAAPERLLRPEAQTAAADSSRAGSPWSPAPPGRRSATCSRSSRTRGRWPTWSSAPAGPGRRGGRRTSPRAAAAQPPAQAEPPAARRHRRRPRRRQHARTWRRSTRRCVADAIFESAVPVVSAVGHEIDVSSPTWSPTTAALTPSPGRSPPWLPDRARIDGRPDRPADRLREAMAHRVELARQRVDRLADRPALRSRSNGSATWNSSSTTPPGGSCGPPTWPSPAPATGSPRTADRLEGLAP